MEVPIINRNPKIIICLILFISMLLTGCYSGVHVIDHIELSPGEKLWIKISDGQYAYHCDECEFRIITSDIDVFNLEFMFLIIPFFETDTNVLKLGVSFKRGNKHIPISVGSFMLEEESIQVNSLSKTLSLLGFDHLEMNDFIQEDDRPYKGDHYWYDFGLANLDDDNFQIEIIKPFQVHDMKAGMTCDCNVAPLKLKKTRNLQFGAGVIGHYDKNAGPLMFMFTLISYLLLGYLCYRIIKK